MKGQSFAGLALLRESMRKKAPLDLEGKDKKEEAVAPHETRAARGRRYRVVLEARLKTLSPYFGEAPLRPLFQNIAATPLRRAGVLIGGIDDRFPRTHYYCSACSVRRFG